MKLGLHIPDFTWQGGPTALGERLVEVAQLAEQGGFDRISVMDHLWQIAHLGPPEHEMLEAYTTLGFLAGKTERVRLLTMVTAVVYRDPGLLAKAVTTLDVLSGGRAMLGIGAAWNEEEAHGLGLFFPSTAERFERLEEALQICQQMWSDDDGPYEGKHYRLGRTLNSPQSLSRPHPPILIGGAGSARRCGWWPAMPMRATSSTPRSWPTSSMCFETIATGRVGTTPRSRRPFRCGSTWANMVSGSRRRSNICTSWRSWVSRLHMAVSPTLVRFGHSN